jgi:hypothetical protein
MMDGGGKNIERDETCTWGGSTVQWRGVEEGMGRWAIGQCGMTYLGSVLHVRLHMHNIEN